MDKVLNILKGVFTAPIFWVLLAVAPSYYGMGLQAVVGVTSLCWILGRSFASWEFCSEEIRALRKLKRPIRKALTRQALSLLTWVSAFSAICYSVFFIAGSNTVVVDGELFLLLGWLLVILISKNFFDVTQARFSPTKRFSSFFFLILFLFIFVLNYKLNYSSFHLHY